MPQAGMRKIRGWAGTGAYVALLALLYRDALGYLVRQWNREDFSYGYLLPFVLAYLVWQKRAELRAEPSRPSWAGLGILAAGLGLFWLGELGGEFYTLDLSLWLSAVGLLWLHLGRRKLRLLAFPVGTALLLFPPPNFLYTKISLRLKLLSSTLGVRLIELFGGTAYREGNVIDLGFTRLQVVDACSGLRYVFPLFVMGLLIGYVRHRSPWKRAVLALSTVPLSVAVNGVRIAGTAGLAAVFGPKVAEGALHDAAGWVIFVVSCGLIVAMSEALNFVRREASEEPVRREASEEPVRREVSDVRSNPSPLTPDASRDYPSPLALHASLPPGAPLTPHASPLVAAFLLLAATIALSTAVDFRERVPIRRPLAELPLELPGWSGTVEAMEPRFRRVLFFSDYAMVDYRDPEGRVVSLYVAYYDTQRKGEAIHSPETCLPGSGWVFREAGATDLAAGSAGGVRVSRALMENAGARNLTYFWFAQGGRTLTSLTSLKFHTFWQALTRRRTDGALVRLITPIADSEPPERADERLRGFARLIVPVLSGFLPE
jgi:EpsI family protein